MKNNSDTSVSRRAFIQKAGFVGAAGLVLGLSGAKLRAADEKPVEAPKPPAGGEGGRGEIPNWGEPYPRILNKASVVAAITDYLLQTNVNGYRPNPRKVLAVRNSDRTAILRTAGVPLRHEIYYFVEGEIFAEPGVTRLKEGATPESQAAELVEQVWEPLFIWAAYDFVRGSSSGFKKPFAAAPAA
jgi:hypothetical protein